MANLALAFTSQWMSGPKLVAVSGLDVTQRPFFGAGIELASF